MALESTTFFNVIEKHQLVSEKQLASLKAAVKKETVSQADLESMVAKKFFTKWQAQRLLSGKHNFSVEDYRLLDFLGKDEFGEVYLVRPKDSKKLYRLKLVSKELCSNAENLKLFLDRVQSFQTLQNPRIPKVLKVSSVGGRSIVVTELPAGRPLVERLGGKSQSEKLVSKIVERIAKTLGELGAAGLRHGTINGHSIHITDQQKLALDLPGDICLCAAPKNKSQSDIASLGWVACGLLSGDFGKPQISGSKSADKLFEIASNSDATVIDILQAIGISPEDDSTDSIVPVNIDASVPSVPDQSVVEDAVPSIIEVSNSENGALVSQAGNAEPIPEIVTVESPVIVADEIPEIVTDEIPVTAADGMPDVAASEIPEVVADIPALPNVTNEGLESFGKKDDMFGDFDNVEVVSEMQSPQSFGSVAPVVVENAYPATQAGQATPASQKTEQPETETPAGKNKTILFASIGGGVAIILVGLLIYFLNGGNKGKDGQVASNNTSNESNDSKSPGDDKESDENPGSIKKKELKSSGMFKGAFNSDPNKAGSENANKGSKENPKTDSSANQANKNQPKDDGNTPPSKGTDPTSPMPNTDGPNKKTVPNKNPDSTNANGGANKKSGGLMPNGSDSKGTGNVGNPNKSKTDVGDANPKKSDEDVLDDGKKDGDADSGKKKNDNPVLLLDGNDNKKKETDNQPPKKLANPFAQAPNFVTLQLAKKGAGNIGVKQILFPMPLPPSLPLTVTLHGGDAASKAKIEFALKASTSENATWTVTAGAKSSLKPIAKFTHDGENFCFTWTSEAEGFSNSTYLINCALRIQASQYIHELALRAPAISSPLAFDKDFSPTSDAKLENLPNMENVKIVLVNIPADFAKFDFPKGKDFLVGRADSTRLYFRQKNIDVIHGQLASKLRGSKMLVNLELKYVTPDKQFEKMTSFDKFEKFANQVITQANELKVEYDRLMKEHNKLPTKEEKAAFTRQYGITKMREQNTLARRYSGHVSNTLATVKGIKSKELGVRIYYQAGEIEVDLATPGGKKYTQPAPAPTPDPKQGAPKKAAAKKAPPKKTPAKKAAKKTPSP